MLTRRLPIPRYIAGPCRVYRLFRSGAPKLYARKRVPVTPTAATDDELVTEPNINSRRVLNDI